MRAGILVPPQNFGLVEDGLYRSGQPTELSYPFLEQLQLRTILHLSADEPPAEFASWASEQRIQLVRLGAGADANMLSPWKPVSEEVVVEGLRRVLDPSSYPLLVMCNLGRHRTGTLIGCLRKLQCWSLTSVLEEYRRHACAKSRHLNEQFIELFDIDLVRVPEHSPPQLHLQAERGKPAG
ncbi:hypothetical protein EMIHUDRAFT_76826 [Emiliania huxleyi CCMP1516]|uniref:protein-tyrosine-phosphatase n=2 Tax=Emiliania huxleyi TaxID=2903 RepID=A0A0D3IJM7_EMIH1|nr:hypothetical protein EMIHUDRAFT_76826 [Emiliania huxleyi CCMP1516]EOD11462.1 hypothetical protein EMIHUDRAFT_76826 [Emiliania huxleyi CCMP1516]|eukprot:XP_005763891.1 hypothetical protein EMIHUDRAFT_76826 [Emiliania huxleyi CCMP1516]